MPFRYGIATMTELPHVILALTFEIDGHTATGIAADHLPPKWFTKDPARAPLDEIDDMVAVIRAAVNHARGVRAPTVFGFWCELYAAQVAWAECGNDGTKVPPLLAHFGTSLVERALIDAFGRERGVSFATGLRENIFGVDLGALRPELAGSAPRDWLPAQPAETLIARHTVGLGDALEDGDITPEERVDDGLPQALDACVRFYGLRHFKIKINGEAARDRDRLTRMAGIFARECAGRDWAFSLDGNESFREVGAFADYTRGLMAAPELAALWPRLWFIEQPWHRDVALSPAIGELARAWPERPPIIIDESDGELSSMPAALALGYAGTSHKNCKGIFKGVANACRLAQRRAVGNHARGCHGHKAPAVLARTPTDEEAHPQPLESRRLCDDLGKAPSLVGGQRIHRVDHQRLDAVDALRSTTCAVVKHRVEKTLRLAAAGAGGYQRAGRRAIA